MTIRLSTISDEFYVLPDGPTATFMDLVSCGYSGGRMHEVLRNLAVLDWQGARYIAASNRYLAVYYPVSDMPVGDYEGLPYFRKIPDDKTHSNLLRVINGHVESISYTFTMYTDEFDVEFFDGESSARQKAQGDDGAMVLLGKTCGSTFKLDDNSPYQWVIDQDLFNTVMDSLITIKSVQVIEPNKSILFRGITGVLAVLMPLNPETVIEKKINGKWVDVVKDGEVKS